MINLLQKTSKELAQEIQKQRFQIDLLEREVRYKEHELETLKKRAEELQEKMDEFEEDIAELREYKHPMKVRDSMRLSGLLMILLDKVGFDTESLRATGEHYSDNFDVIRVFMPDLHGRGNYQIHIVPEKKYIPHEFKERPGRSK
jgi:predicted RNase H-like nuclease (RuvC/YqgF family)